MRRTALPKPKGIRGKSAATSVPSFCFTPGNEDLKELPPDTSDQEDNSVVKEEVGGSSGKAECEPGPSAMLELFHIPDDSDLSLGEAPTSAGTQGSSPVKESVQKTGKRSSSLDSASGPASSTDTWNVFLHEIKGKITRKLGDRRTKIRSISETKESVSVSDTEEYLDNSGPSKLESRGESKELEDLPCSSSGELFSNGEKSKGFLSNLISSEQSLQDRIRPKLAELRNLHCIPSGDFVIPMSALTSEASAPNAATAEPEVESGVEAAEMDELSKAPRPPPPPKHTASTAMSLLSYLTWVNPLYWAGALGLLFLLPMSPFFSGFLLGGALVALAFGILYILTKPQQAKKLLIPDYSKLPPLENLVKEYAPLDRYEGWMNQLMSDYDPETFHIRQTYSVFVRLEGSIIRLSYPLKGVPRRAMWNEPKVNPYFIHQKMYDISDCQIKLLPEGLSLFRRWRKKYPIIIKLQKTSDMSLSSKMLPKNDPSPTKSSDVTDITAGRKSPVNNGGFASIEKHDSLEYLDAASMRDRDGKDSESSMDEDDSFLHVTRELYEVSTLILFARTDREKDDWFRRFVAASRCSMTPVNSKATVLSESDEALNQAKEESQGSEGDAADNSVESLKVELVRYMAKFVASENGSKPDSKPGTPQKVSSRANSEEESKETHLQDCAWLNALIARFFFDFNRNDFCVALVQDLLQKKLRRIRVPYFMDELIVKELKLGSTTPIIQRASKPDMDERGLWISLDVSYAGECFMTLETKLNLMKLKNMKTPAVSSPKKERKSPSPTEKNFRSLLFMESEGTSGSSSSDEDRKEFSEEKKWEESGPAATSQGESASRRILRMVDKIASSRYFQQATEYKVIKRAMEGVSKTPLLLSVEVKGLVGTFVINVPPYPADRVWYGFRGNPVLLLSAKPKLGERQVTVTHVTDWIENKMALEFQKLFVLPNMDDIVIPVLTTRLPE